MRTTIPLQLGRSISIRRSIYCFFPTHIPAVDNAMFLWFTLDKKQKEEIDYAIR